MELHIIVYVDHHFAYVGMDVFSSFAAALRQFDARYAETLEEHGGDSERFSLYTRNPEIRELHFIDKDFYEVFYRTEKLQEE